MYYIYRQSGPSLLIESTNSIKKKACVYPMGGSADNWRHMDRCGGCLRLLALPLVTEHYFVLRGSDFWISATIRADVFVLAIGKGAGKREAMVALTADL